MATAAIDLERTHTGIDKVERYNWTTTPERSEPMRLHKRLLNVDQQHYQREGQFVSKAKIAEFKRNWSWGACSRLVVSQRPDGTFWVIDGQHRKLAADHRSDIQELPCEVIQCDTIEEEAALFLLINTNRKPVPALAKFKGELGAKDPLAIFVNDVVRGCGLRFATASAEPGDFKAVAVAKELAKLNRDAFVVVMQLAAELALEAGAPVHKRLLDGLSYIHANVEGGLENQRLRKRIKQVGLTALLRGADSAHGYYAKGGAKVYADGMLQAINKGLRIKFEFA